MITYAAIIAILIGLAFNLVLQAWVQPRAFRADNKIQADLIIGRFDAQLESLKQISENASRTLDEASRFFKSSEDRFQEIERRLSIVEEGWKTTHRLVEEVTRLDKRLACVESVCNATHERSLRNEMVRRIEGEEG